MSAICMTLRSCSTENNFIHKVLGNYCDTLKSCKFSMNKRDEEGLKFETLQAQLRSD